MQENNIDPNISIEDKILLIKDLCARIPYAVEIAHKSGFSGTLHEITSYCLYDGDDVKDMECGIDFFGDNDYIKVEYFRPYLIPLSKMTAKQNEEWRDYWFPDLMSSTDFSYPESEKYLALSHAKSMEWLYAHHFDVNGLIEKGLAIDASELNIY